MNEAETRAELIDPAPREVSWAVVADSRTRREMIARDQFEVFESCVSKCEDVAWSTARAPKRWAEQIGCAQSSVGLSGIAETRDCLIDDLRNVELPIEASALRILAWGGMRTNHGRALFGRNSRDWLAVCEAIRRGELDRAAAYQGFARLRSDGRLKGMGAAYFTKLIYFLMPRNGPDRPVGYIMDQWVSCSVNVLATEPFVKVGRSYVVTDRNDACIYERYCRMIEQLAQTCNLNADALEMQLMSRGGRKPASWRAHVLAHRKPNP